MQNYDSEKAARVWQRVRNEEPVPVELSALPGFAAAENELAELLRRLSRQYPAAGALSTECRRHATVIRGVCALGGIPCRTAPFTGEIPRELLRSCYGKTLQLLREYEARREHPEYGCAFQALAEKKRAQACLLLELAGRGIPTK